MSSTKVVIENFRNIGYNPELNPDKKTIFLLNRSNNKDYCGDLCIILGKNNSGKSNILSALKLLNISSKYTESDIPKNLETSNTKNKKLEPDVHIYGIKQNANFNNIYEEIIRVIIDYFDELKNQWVNVNNNYNYNNGYSVPINNGNNNLFSLNIENITHLLNNSIRYGKKISNKNWEKEIKSLNIFKNYDKDSYSLLEFKDFLEQIQIAISFLKNKDYEIFKLLFNVYNLDIFKNWLSSTKINDKLNETLDIINKLIEQNYQYDVIFVDNTIYKNSDFSIECTKEKINSNIFFKTIFSITEIDIDEFIENTNGDVSNWHFLQTINKKLDKISDDFNNVFSLFNKKVKYSFSLSGDSKLKFGFSLMILENNNDNSYINQNYDQQSSGFKWFFNFFFTFWSEFHDNNKQKIILLDEPGNGLSMNSLIQLRNFLKKIAYKYGVTFVLTTHRFEWINLDYLEELRIIQKPLTEVEIHNDFTLETNKKESWIIDLIRSVETNFVNIGSSETLEEFDDTKNYVLVEGITDYLYLTAIKLYFINNENKDKQFINQLQHIYFLPINGVEIKEENMKKKFQLYQKILRAKKFLFIVDNDNAGKDFKKTINNDILVKTLGDIVDKKDIKTIENFISEKDIKDFELVDNDNKKHANNSYEFKRALINNKVSKETISNLTSLLKAIIDEVY